MFSPKSGNEKFPRPLAILIIVAAFLVISGGLVFYIAQKNKLLTHTYSQLDLITSVKAEEIRRWLFEHMRDGYIIASFSSLNRDLPSILRGNINNRAKTELLNRIELFTENYDYTDVLIVDTAGRIRLMYPDPGMDLTERPYSDHKNNNSAEIDFSDLHFSPFQPGMHIDMVIPIMDSADSGTVRIGSYILRIDPDIILFPVIQSLQIAGRTSETMLLRRDGDSVTYLTSVKLNPGTPGPMKRSLDELDLPAAVAVQGTTGRFEGNDYRGVPVLSFIRKVPNSDWFIVAKIDRSEAMTFLHWQTIMASIIVFLFIFFFIAIIFYLWKRQNSQFYKEIGLTKDRFVSIITHDLTNPFTSIVGFSEFLLGDLRNKNYLNAEKFAKIIHDSSISALDLLKDLAQWSKIQTNQIRLNLTKIDISLMIQESVELLKASANRKSITIHKNIPPELNVIADKEMINTILRNLIVNAIKYSKEGGVIFIRAEKKENEISVGIMDFGVGMSQDMIGKIFKTDEKFTTPGTLAETGTGLGLSLCKEFISRHGGKLLVESEAGKGSNFMFTIPSGNA